MPTSINYLVVSGLRSIVFLLSLCLIYSNLVAQADWKVNPADFEHSMSVIGTAWLHGEELNSDGAMIGAFMNGQCVGVASPLLHEASGRYLFYIVVFGNSEHIQQSIQIKLYRSGSPVVVQQETIKFEIDGMVGNAYSPYVVAEPALAEGTDIFSFDLGTGMLDIQIGQKEIMAIMDISATLEQLPVRFELSEGAMLLADGKPWVSGESILDYTDPVQIQIYSQGLFYKQEYTLRLRQEQDEVIANNFISPNNDGYNDFWTIHDAHRYADYEFEIKSKQGEVVFSQTGYEIPWDGRYNEKVLSADTYWYLITNPYTKQEFRGYITLVY